MVQACVRFLGTIRELFLNLRFSEREDAEGDSAVAALQVGWMLAYKLLTEEVDGCFTG
jgi:hypothetical protein